MQSRKPLKQLPGASAGRRSRRRATLLSCYYTVPLQRTGTHLVKNRSQSPPAAPAPSLAATGVGSPAKHVRVLQETAAAGRSCPFPPSHRSLSVSHSLIQNQKLGHSERPLLAAPPPPPQQCRASPEYRWPINTRSMSPT
jgi:hypothetical protein